MATSNSMASSNAASPIGNNNNRLVQQSLIQALLKSKSTNSGASPIDLLLSNLDMSTRALLLSNHALGMNQRFKGGAGVSQQEEVNSPSIDLLLSLLSKEKPNNLNTSGETSAASNALLTAALTSGGYPPVAVQNKNNAKSLSSSASTTIMPTLSHSPQSVLVVGGNLQGMALLPPAVSLLGAPHLASSQTEARLVGSESPQEILHEGCREDSASHDSTVVDNKKKQKRAANRISAQQSRKRKKQYIDDLKEENDELRKLNHVLTLLPDLILAFDSSGAIRFVSRACVDVFGSSPSEVEGTSFWRRICPKSAPLLKAAFMDALAAREKTGKSSVSFGERVWEIRIKKVVDPIDHEQAGGGGPTWTHYTLHGIVHFGGNVPECICTIRPTTPREPC